MSLAGGGEEPAGCFSAGEGIFPLAVPGHCGHPRDITTQHPPWSPCHPWDMEGGPRGLLHPPGTWHVHAGAWQPARLCLLSPNDLKGTRGHRRDRPHTQKFCCWLQNQPQKRGWRRGGRHECSKMGWRNCPVQPCPVLPWTPKQGCPRTGVSPRSRAPPVPWKGLPPTIDHFLVTFQFSEPLGQRAGAVSVAVPAGTLRVSR